MLRSDVLVKSESCVKTKPTVRSPSCSAQRHVLQINSTRLPLKLLQPQLQETIQDYQNKMEYNGQYEWYSRIIQSCFKTLNQWFPTFFGSWPYLDVTKFLVILMIPFQVSLYAAFYLNSIYFRECERLVFKVVCDVFNHNFTNNLKKKSAFLIEQH